MTSVANVLGAHRACLCTLTVRCESRSMHDVQFSRAEMRHRQVLKGVFSVARLDEGVSVGSSHRAEIRWKQFIPYAIDGSGRRMEGKARRRVSGW